MITSIATAVDVDADASQASCHNTEHQRDVLPTMPISQRGLQLLSRINHLFDTHREQSRELGELITAPAQ